MNYRLRKLLGEYFWVIGISLVVVGATKLFDDALGILISGALFFLIGSMIKSI